MLSPTSNAARDLNVVVVGAGPAGLTAAYELAKHGYPATVLESDAQVGGISRTVERDGWRFDLGGHRFFTKVQRVEAFWHEILNDRDFLLRPRMSRIYYNGRFFDYPLRATNALRNLGIVESIRCVGSYLAARIFPPKDQSTFEGWVAARFGWRLYRIFFKTYTEKVWGVPATKIQSDWAAQRIKNLSLASAVVNALMPRGRNSKKITSLIEQFKYPKLGPGMMWETCAEKAEALGVSVRLDSPVTQISRNSTGNLTVRTATGDLLSASHVISTMPINHLVEALLPRAPEAVCQAAAGLRHRDFLTVALVIPAEDAFPDNWIYVHSPNVRVGRIQNFGSWSPCLVKDGLTCLGLEYFVSRGDDLWESADDQLIDLGAAELMTLSIVQARPTVGFVVRVENAYPVYDKAYAENVKTIREFLEEDWPDIRPVGRNGMHRYNNQDHSMLTAMYTVDNLILGTQHDVWNVNVEDDYHETVNESDQPIGTGRSAPFTG